MAGVVRTTHRYRRPQTSPNQHCGAKLNATVTQRYHLYDLHTVCKQKADTYGLVSGDKCGCSRKSKKRIRPNRQRFLLNLRAPHPRKLRLIEQSIKNK